MGLRTWWTLEHERSWYEVTHIFTSSLRRKSSLLEALELIHDIAATDNIFKQFNEFVTCMLGTIECRVEIHWMQHDIVKGNRASSDTRRIVPFCSAEKVFNFTSITKVGANFYDVSAGISEVLKNTHSIAQGLPVRHSSLLG